MKTLLLCLSLFIAACCQAQEEYVLKINDSTYRIESGKTYETKINGKKASFSLNAIDTLQYNDELFSFKYPKGYTLSKIEIQKGIEQLTLITAEGSGILVQKYDIMNPSKMNEIMLSEVTKENVSYGYVLKREDYDRILPSGQTIRVNKAVMTYKEELNIIEVATIGGKDEGILVVTMIMDKDINAQGKKLIGYLWNSLNYKR